MVNSDIINLRCKELDWWSKNSLRLCAALTEGSLVNTSCRFVTTINSFLSHRKQILCWLLLNHTVSSAQEHEAISHHGRWWTIGLTISLHRHLQPLIPVHQSYSETRQRACLGISLYQWIHVEDHDGWLIELCCLAVMCWFDLLCCWGCKKTGGCCKNEITKNRKIDYELLRYNPP